MNIHLVRSPEVDEELFNSVYSILCRYEGALQFVSNDVSHAFDSIEIVDRPFIEDRFRNKNIVARSISNKMTRPDVCYSLIENWPPPNPERIKIVTWNSIFSKCQDYRKENFIPENEPVIILTNFINDKNWFSASDPSGALNFFVCTDQWELFLPCDPRFPVAYETIAVIFRHYLFGSFESIIEHAHQEPRGCVNDFCKDRKQITLMLRTADLCNDCHQYMHTSKMDPLLVSQFFQTIDNIRTQMLFRERYKVTQQLSRMEIRGTQRKIYFTGLGDAELKLTPLEKIVYLLFLLHTDGLHINEVYNHTEWIEKEYAVLGNSRTLPEFKNSIHQLTDPTENSLSEKISRIRNKIQKLIGDDLARHYIIEGPRGLPKRILLDRGLVDWN